jgi:hypothetical protein
VQGLVHYSFKDRFIYECYFDISIRHQSAVVTFPYLTRDYYMSLNQNSLFLASWCQNIPNILFMVQRGKDYLRSNTGNYYNIFNT